MQRPYRFGPLIAFAYIVVLWVKIGQRFGRTGLGVLAGMLPIVGAWIFAFLIANEQPAG